MVRRFRLRSLLTLAALILPACGQDQGYRFPVYPTDGRVTWKGQPVPGAFVRFHPKDPAAVQPPAGREGPPVTLTTDTDADGKFSMSTYYADDGVPAGDYVVTVAVGLHGDSDVENSDGRPAKPARRAPAIPATYRDPARSRLKATVQQGENHFVFDLTAPAD